MRTCESIEAEWMSEVSRSLRVRTVVETCDFVKCFDTTFVPLRSEIVRWKVDGVDLKLEEPKQKAHFLPAELVRGRRGQLNRLRT